MIEFKTEKGEFVVVDKESCTDLEIFEISQEMNFGNLKLICKLSEATELEAKDVVDEDIDMWFSIGYKDYENGGQVFNEALDSLHSLLTSKGININNGNWYLFKKIK